jgi:hypothetical protein
MNAKSCDGGRSVVQMGWGTNAHCSQTKTPITTGVISLSDARFAFYIDSRIMRRN